MPTIPKILATTALCLAAVGVSSCTVSTNFGGLLNDIGVKEAYYIAPKATAVGPITDLPRELAPSDLCIYQLGDAYYMELHCRYLQISSGLFRVWSVRGGGSDSVEVLARDRKARYETPVESFMVLMDSDTIKKCLQITVPEPPKDTKAFIAYRDFDFRTATRCKPNPERDAATGQYYNLNDYFPEMPLRKSTLHFVLQPLAWPLMAIERIPECAVMATAAIVVLPCAPVLLWQEQQQQQDTEDPVLINIDY